MEVGIIGTAGGGGKKTLANTLALVVLLETVTEVMLIGSDVQRLGMWVLEKSVGSLFIYLLAIYMSVDVVSSSHLVQWLFLVALMQFLNNHAASLCLEWAG